MLFIKDSEFDRVVSLARNRMFAKIYYREKRVISIDVQQSYYGYEISGTVMIHGKYYNCYIETNRQSKITSWECGCYFNSEFSACAHVGAVILQVQELSPSSYPFHYESDLNEIFRRKREEERQRLAELERRRIEQERLQREAITKQLSGDIQQSIRNSFESTHVAKPMIYVVYNGNESFRFKIGETRTYFIKKLNTFVDNMNHHDVVRYGKPFVWKHDVNDLDEVSRNLYYNLIMRHYDNRYDYYSRDYQSIHVENDNIDDFYEMLSLYPERFEDITLEAYDELVPIVIDEDDYDYIIESRVTFYDNYFGKTNCYYFEDNSLHYRKGDANGIFVKLLQAFFANNNRLYVQKTDFENFYRNVLEPVKSYFNIDSRVDFSFEDCED
ncbi:MAG: hypothetical protein J6P61_04230, partial [Erysipelotrichaceae bacterium]|nr:hypothetical protein [Erysipelotrichaceae bacterium]